MSCSFAEREYLVSQRRQVGGYDEAEIRWKRSSFAAKVRALRADEKNVYAAVRECFKISSSDYDKDSQETRSFYARLQDKFHYAVAGKTASQVILDRADHRQPDMGLRTMQGATPLPTDATVAKNYLDGDELYTLHLLCEQFLLYAESKALRGQKMTMKELARK